MGNEEAVPVAVDPLEEVLEQSSQQTLKLAHIDDGVTQLKSAVDDMSETMQAGFVELRQVASQKPEPAAPQPRLTLGNERIDELELSVRTLSGKVGMLLGVVVIELLVVVALALVSFGVIKSPAHQPEAVVAPPPAAVVPVEAPKPPEPEPPPAKVKKKGKH